MANSLKSYTSEVKNTRVNGTPQTARTPGRTDEVRNNAGGFVFGVTPKTRLERFLILGTDGGTFYVSERKLTRDNVKFLKDLIKSDERLVIDTLRDVAVNNRAPKNSPSLFTLAVLMHNAEDKAAVRALVKDVARTSTHLFEYAGYLKDLGGLGRAKRGSLADWYTDKTADQLAYQVVKYRQRDGWTHRDVLRLAHPKGVDPAVGNFILNGEVAENAPALVADYERMSKAGSVKEVIAILNDNKRLPWETVPTQFLKDADVWKTIFYNGGLGQTALIRNLSRFEEIGAFKDVKFMGDVAKALADEERIAKGRVHPVQYANALGMTKRLPGKVRDGEEAGFYASFKTVEPANVPTLLGLDVSGSMTWGQVAGLKGLMPLEVAAVMAMVTVRTEPYVLTMAFSTSFQKLNLGASDNFETIKRKMSGLNFGGTDVSVPMLWAKQNKVEVDAFAVYTDNETWAGNVKPNKALEQYRNASGRNARLATVGLTATNFTIADPKDAGMLDFVGFDSAAPAVMSNFFAGRV